jgi:signal transduction histidine kinase
LPRVAASLAHNVNNSLTAVIGCLELALRDAPAGTPLHGRLNDGLGCALRLAERVRRLVAFAMQPGAGEAAPTSLREAAEAGARRTALAYPRVAATVSAVPGECRVRVNLPLLNLVLEQLVSNAVEAMPSGGALRWRVWDEGRRRCLSLSDTGQGLSAEARAHLFEPFFTTKSFGHLGLGLALCRDVVEGQGGAIHVASAEGQGTTVILSFPPDEGAPAAPATAGPHAPLSHYHI